MQRIRPVFFAAAVLGCVAVIAVVAATRTYRIVDTPELRASSVQCGHWVIFRTSWLLGVPVRMEDLMSILPSSKGGHSLAELKATLENVGLAAEGMQQSYEQFKNGPFPSIVQLKDPDHFVVAAGRGQRSLLVFDGSGKRVRLPESLVQKRWTGYVLNVGRPSPTGTRVAVNGRDPVAGPRAQFDALHIDVGDVARTKTPVRFAFRLTNVGTAPLTIRDVHVDCSCLSVERPKSPLAPGEAGSIVLTFTAPRDNPGGAFNHGAAVTSDDVVYPDLPLTVSGNVDYRITATPKAINFGDVPIGTRVTRHCFIQVLSDVVEEVELGQPVCDLAAVKLRWTTADQFGVSENGPLQAAKRLTPSSKGNRIIEVAFDAAAESSAEGDLAGMIKLQSNVDGFEEISIPILVRVVQPVSTVPDTAVWSDAEQQKDRVKASTVLRSRIGKHIKILSLDIPSPDIRAEYAEGWREQIQITFTTTRLMAALAHNGSVIAHVQVDGIARVFRIPVRLFVSK